MSDITVDHFSLYKNKTAIDSYELCVVIGNLLENAVEAVGQLPKRKRRVSIAAMCDEPLYVAALTIDNGLPVSSKPGG